MNFEISAEADGFERAISSWYLILAYMSRIYWLVDTKLVNDKSVLFSESKSNNDKEESLSRVVIKLVMQHFLSFPPKKNTI